MNRFDRFFRPPAAATGSDDDIVPRAKADVKKYGTLDWMLTPTWFNYFGHKLLETVRAGFKKRDERIDEIERKLAEVVEQRVSSVTFRGVWRSGADYRQNDMAVDSGSSWIALKQTRTRPGKSGDWQLVEKAMQ